LSLPSDRGPRAPSPNGRGREPWIAPGLEHLRRGRFAQAAACLEAAVSRDRGRDLGLRWHAAEARTALGQASLHLADAAGARAQFERALLLWPGFPAAGYPLACLHQRRGLPREALEVLDAAPAAASGIEVQLLRAVCLDQMGDAPAVRRALDRALAAGLRRPLGSAEAAHRAAGVVGPRGSPQRRAGRAGTGPEPRADYADERSRLAARLRDRHPAEAVGHLEAALALNPHFLRARLALALLSLHLGWVARSLALFERARELEPGYPDVLAWLGLARLRAGDAHGAVRALEQAISMRCEFARAHRFLALARHATGRTREALSEARTGLASESDVPGRPGRLRMPGLEAEGAEEDELLRALAIRPRCADLHLALGRRLGEDGAPHDARQAFRAALHLQPGYAEALFELARLELESGRLAEAEGLAAQLVRARPGWVDAQALLGRVRLRMGDARGAVLPLRAALRRRPGLVAARADLSWALMALGSRGFRARAGEPAAWWEPASQAVS
jgi:tetratricopeptide (TPR) repeat protein